MVQAKSDRLRGVEEFLGINDEDAKGVGTAAASGQAGGPGTAAVTPLSSSHISPKKEVEPSIRYAVGGTSVRVHLPTGGAIGGGKRSQIHGFSDGSRRRLLHLVNSIEQTKAAATAFLFITLTYPLNFPSARASKADLDCFIKAFERTFGPHPMIWKLEPQRRGAPHYHLLLLFGNTTDEALSGFVTWVAQTWHRIGGANDPNHLAWHLGQLGHGNKPCVEKVRDWKGVSNYAGKYLGKVNYTTIDKETGEVLGGDWQHSGRYWGVRRKQDLPIEIIREDVTRIAAVRARRWAIAWYERQPPQRFYIPGKCGRPGQRLLGNAMIDLHGFGEEQTVASCIEEISRMCEVQVRPQPRRWGSSRGGCSMFMPAAAFMRIVELAKAN